MTSTFKEIFWDLFKKETLAEKEWYCFGKGFTDSEKRQHDFPTRVKIVS